MLFIRLSQYKLNWFSRSLYCGHLRATSSKNGSWTLRTGRRKFGIPLLGTSCLIFLFAQTLYGLFHGIQTGLQLCMAVAGSTVLAVLSFISFHFALGLHAGCYTVVMQGPLLQKMSCVLAFQPLLRREAARLVRASATPVCSEGSRLELISIV